MHGIDLLLDALALVFLKGNTLNKQQLLEEINQNENASYSDGKLYQAMQRLRFRGFIEEVPSNGRDKPYRLTLRGNEAAKDFAKIFGGKT